MAVKVVYPHLARQAEFRRRFRREVAPRKWASGLRPASSAKQGAGADPEGVRERGEAIPLGEVLVEPPHDLVEVRHLTGPGSLALPRRHHPAAVLECTATSAYRVR
jgi:hypothetical protein